MNQFSISVNLFNPGQVFACLGFLEAAEVLVGHVQGGFIWNQGTKAKFYLNVESDNNPFKIILEFLVRAKLKRWAPIGYSYKSSNKASESKEDKKNDLELRKFSPFYFDHKVKSKEMILPIYFIGEDNTCIDLSHWADESSRYNFKLYAGNRSAYKIARDMIESIKDLWKENQTNLIKDPFMTTHMGGNFNFDSRGNWTSINVGYSLNDQKHQIVSSPVVELLGALGLENARPSKDECEDRKIHYAVWKIPLFPILARAALCGTIPNIPMQKFYFKLEKSGKNKIVTFAQKEDSL